MKTDVLTGKLEFLSLKPCDLSNVTKEEIKAYFNNTYDVYESLFSSINDDSYYYLCPDRLRLPLIFYYGHTAAVYMNKLVLSGLAHPKERINIDCDTIFETGVDEMSWDDTEHYRMGGDYKWPTVEETKVFRLKIKNLINEIIDRTPLELPIKWDSQWWALFMGFEHERIHLETSSVLIRQLPVYMVSKPEKWVYAPLKSSKNEKVVSNEMIRIGETDVRLGKEFDFPSYGWDNEYGRVDCRVTEFEASKFKITNEEYLEFIKAKGYETESYWTKEGWQWLQFRKLKHPSFWVCPDNCKSGCGSKISSHIHCQKQHFTEEELKHFYNFQNNIQNGTLSEIKFSNNDEDENGFRPGFPYKLRLMYDDVNMPYNWPVEIVYHEAKAFCKWKGDDYRLLSEAEHHAIRDKEEFNLNTSSDVIYQNIPANHNLVYGSSTPVNFYQPNTKGFYDVFGNVWEWCEDHFNGLPGFKTTYLYDDFSTPCFDGRHNIIMGGSWISTGDEASRFARFMFRRHFLQHCGFRLARSIPQADGSKSNPQVRLVRQSVFVLGAGFAENPIVLDETKIVINKYDTENKQYLYDSDTVALENELEKEYGGKSNWIVPFSEQLKSYVASHKNGNKMKTAVHIGSSTGRLSFELTKTFDSVVSIDFCGLFLDACLNLMKKEKLEYKTKSDKTIKISLEGNEFKLKNVCFKQMTWIPNEVPSSDFVFFSMIDRVMNQLSWLKRFREIVNKHGLLVIYSEKSIWNSQKIESVIGNDFHLINEAKISEDGLLTLWKN